MSIGGIGSEAVNVDFNIGGNYGASLSQMIAQTEQYAKGADTLIGRVAGLNVGVTKLVTSTAALTGATKIATAEAAAYQQKLAGIHATASVTGQSFSSLEKTTLSLARSFGNLDAAVQTVQALTTSGITAEKSINRLAKTWMELGVANQTSGPQLGQTLLNLGRTFGNSERQLSSFGDALTATSKTYGASADAAANYAKALAPVAQSVGMTQASVMGLGVAASRLGEEGYAGATAFNKVLIDMGRSMRDGTPEIATYAKALGMTQQSLGQLFKQDPTEVLVRFTEAIGKGGPQAMRTLEALGMDSVRTVRSLQAISGQGNLRQIIDTATEQYGSGATSKASKTAMGTLNEEAAKLGETMSQTVAAAGKPYIGFLEMVMKAANAASEAIHGLVASAPLQALQRVAAVGSFAFGAASSAVTGLGLLGLGTMGVRALGRGRQSFRTATEAERLAPGETVASGMFGRAGQAWGAFMPVPTFGAGGGMGSQLASTMFWRRGAQAAGRGALNLGSILMDASGRMMDPLTGKTTPYTREGQTVRNTLSEIWRPRDGAGGVNAIDDFGKKVTASGIALGTYTKDVTTASRSMHRFTASALRLGASTVGAGVGVLGTGASLVGRAGAAFGMHPLGMGLAAGAIGYSVVSGWQRDSRANREEAVSGYKDANATFNEFAAAAGMAARELVSLSEQLARTTQDIANAGPQETPGVFNAEMYAQTQAPGYNRAFNTKAAGWQDAVRNARATGISNTPEGASRASMDIVNRYGLSQDEGQQVLNALLASGPTVDIPGLIEQGGRSYTWRGATGRTGEVGTALSSGVALNEKRVTDIYGQGAGLQARRGSAADIYSSAVKSGDSEQMNFSADQLAILTGIDKDVLKKSMAGGVGFDSMLRQAATGSVRLGLASDPLAQTMGVSDAGRNRAEALLNAPSLREVSAMQGPTNAVLNTRKLDSAFEKLTGRTASLAGAMEEANTKTRELGKLDFSELSPLEKGNVSELGRWLQYTREAPGDRKIGGRAAQLAADQAMGQAGAAGTPGAMLALQQAGAMAGDQDPTVRAAYAQATAIIARQQIVRGAGMSMMSRTAETIASGRIAEGMGVQDNEEAEAARQQALTDEQSALAERLNYMKNFLQASKNLNDSLVRADEDMALQRAQINEDYQRNIANSTEDFNRQRAHAVRDFNKQMARAAEDAAKSLYDPYQRMQAQQVWDTGALMQNIAEQNAAIVKQTSQVARLRRAGLSQGAIDTLSLSDPKNAQQVSRMVMDLVANPNMIRQLNAQVAQRIRATRSATQNENNVDFRRTKEDFEQAMDDSAEAFEIGMDRMAEAHDLTLDRMADAAARSRRRAQEDLAKMGEEVTGSYAQIHTRFLRTIGKLPDDVKNLMSTNTKTLIAESVTDAFDTLLSMDLFTSGSVAQSMEQYFLALAEKWGASATKRTIGPKNLPPDLRPTGAGGGAGPVTPVGSIKQTLPNDWGDAINTAAAEASSSSRNWQGWCDRFVAVAYGLGHSGYESAKTHWDAIPAGLRSGGTLAPPGALYFWGNGEFGHVALSAGGGQAYSTDFERPGKVDLVRASDISNQWGSYRGWSYPYFSGETAPIPMARGGIVGRPTYAHLGEGGDSEAVLPLNIHGAKILADTMVRYVEATQVQGARMMGYATPTVNSYAYDQSVRVNGPISVVSSDPNEMARKLEEKTRMDRLVQPAGR